MKHQGPAGIGLATTRDPSELVGPMTIALPAIALPAVMVRAPPPALITRRNAAHVGMTGAELVRVLREMRADPRFRDAVIARGKSFRASPPDAIVAFLRTAGEAPASSESGTETCAEEGVDMNLLRAAGYELEPVMPKDRPAKGDHAKGGHSLGVRAVLR